MRFLKADKVFDGLCFLEPETVIVIDQRGCIIDLVASEQVANQAIETIEGIICPGFVNAHCHLELSHLAGTIPQKIGLVNFALAVIQTRQTLPEHLQLQAMESADAAMYNKGIVAVGDISNTVLSAAVKAKSKLYYHTFVELIGLNPARAEAAFEAGLDVLRAFQKSYLAVSLAPHAPYSTSTTLMDKMAYYNAAQNQVSSIHNQECEAENIFMKGEASAFEKLYSTLNIPIDWFKPNANSSFQYYAPHLNASVPQLLVHNTFMSAADAELAAKTNTRFCFCPKANLYIENRLPHFSNFKLDTFCVGTDSLASNSQLDVLEEVNELLASTVISVEQALRAITSNGAMALQCHNQFGFIKQGLTPGLNVIQQQQNQLRFIKKWC